MHHGSHDKEMIEREKQIIEYNIIVEELAIQYQNANSSSQADIKEELQKNLGNLFDLKELQRESEVRMLEKEITKLKEKIASRKKNKEIIIRRRAEELLGEDSYLEWE